MTGSAPPYRAMAALALVALLQRVAFAMAADAWVPFGEDAEFWGYRSVEILHGQLTGSHPPVYPLLAAVASLLPGLDLPTAATIVAWAGGIAMAPAMAAGVAAVAGRRAGIAGGVLTLLLPNLLAWSVRVEPSSVFVSVLGLALVLVGQVVSKRSVPAALALGLTVALLGLTKENGQYYLLPLALPAVLATRRRWATLGLAVLLGAAIPWYGYQWLEQVQPAMQQLGEKARLPFSDMVRLLEEGRVPAPVMAGDDAVLRPSDHELATLRAEGTTAADRLRWALQLQLTRLVRFLGPWLIVVPATAAGVLLLWRRGRIARWQAALLLGAQATIGLGVVVLVQARHAEVALLGTVWASGVVAAALWERGRPARIALLAVGVALAAHGTWLTVTLEVPRARHIAAIGREMRAAAGWIEAHVPADAAVASPHQWTGLFLEQPSVAWFEHPPEGRPLFVLLADAAGHGPAQVPKVLAPIAPARSLQATQLGRVGLFQGRAPRHLARETVPQERLSGRQLSSAEDAVLYSPGLFTGDGIPEDRYDGQSPQVRGRPR